MTRATRSAPQAVVGWRERVVLDDLCPTPIAAKVDTGARTSALHAFDLSIHVEDGHDVATFEIHPVQRSDAEAVEARCPVHAYRDVRSSNGEVEHRPVVVTSVRLGRTSWPIELTLTSRDEMGYRMLLGRAAVRRRFLVDPGRSYVQSRARRERRP